ncbi:MAG: hypothetical protein LBP79_06515 [Clostridiales bacterium]|jgi:protein-tyrosine-phosphatase|nr:hypothetical protein [Clostridiales bacterium]
MKKILFVCTGNICRSPMAEFIFNLRAAKDGVDARAESAGIGAFDGGKMSEYAARTLAERYGTDAAATDKFRSRYLSFEMLKEYDYVVCMTVPQKSAVEDKAFGLSESAFETFSGARRVSSEFFYGGTDCRGSGRGVQDGKNRREITEKNGMPRYEFRREITERSGVKNGGVRLETIKRNDAQNGGKLSEQTARGAEEIDNPSEGNGDVKCEILSAADLTGGCDVSDPYGGDISAYKSAARRIEFVVDALIKKLKANKVKKTENKEDEPD